MERLTREQVIEKLNKGEKDFSNLGLNNLNLSNLDLSHLKLDDSDLSFSDLTGAKLYDWWNINQVKNVSKEKTLHPCQMPLEVMENIIGILPKDAIIVDPFMGSGTTGVACKELGRDFIGIEIDKQYFDIANERIEESKNEKE